MGLFSGLRNRKRIVSGKNLEGIEPGGVRGENSMRRDYVKYGSFGDDNNVLELYHSCCIYGCLSMVLGAGVLTYGAYWLYGALKDL